MSTASLYEKLGGEAAVQAVVEEFYKRILADDTINSFFTGTDMEKLRGHQVKFISFALDGPNQYSGKSMEKAHAGMNLQPQHFQAVAKHLHGALAQFNVSEEDIDEVLTRVASLKDFVLYK
ncbi:group 1 truncated hemoglobin [Paenibacillus sp. P26]|nr:group 1 truncated hemoglobin [Paenibacillus sp. P26]UUZ92036.1 group 1 truncated hemoglobin [Paenibacillus sp. P25]